MVDGLRKKGAPQPRAAAGRARHPARRVRTRRCRRSRATATRFVEWVKALAEAPDARLYTAAEAKAMWKHPRVRSARRGRPRLAHRSSGKAGTMRRSRPRSLGAYLRELRALLDEYQYRTGVLRALRARLHPHAGQLRSGDRGGHPQVRRLRRSRGRPRRALRRVALRRARRRPVARRAAAEDVRRRADGRVPRVQGDLGSGQQAESRASSIDAYLPTENLRLGADYAPRRPITHFAFPDDGGSLRTASLRCVGLGECRKHDTGSMCPSYMVTLEEAAQHARPRAHAVRAAAGRSRAGRLAGRARQEVARPVPVVQGVQVRVPDQRRHRHLSRRVPRRTTTTAGGAPFRRTRSA